VIAPLPERLGLAVGPVEPVLEIAFTGALAGAVGARREGSLDAVAGAVDDVGEGGRAQPVDGLARLAFGVGCDRTGVLTAIAVIDGQLRHAGLVEQVGRVEGHSLGKLGAIGELER
jgi:hypothetical protein